MNERATWSRRRWNPIQTIIRRMRAERRALR
jgi:hypothetical protein